jgi:hypothetical protein
MIDVDKWRDQIEAWRDRALAGIDHAHTRMRRGELRVVSGRHAGAVATVGAAPVSIGSSPQDDVVVIAGALEPGHARVTLIRAVKRRAEIEARNGAVNIKGFGVLSPGYAVDVALPVEMNLGGVAMALHATRWSAGIDQKIMRKVAGFAVIGLLLFVLTEKVLPLAELRIETLSAIPQPVSQSAQAEPSRKIFALREILHAAGLGDQVAIEKGADGQLALTGAIQGQAAIAAWRAFLAEADERGTLSSVGNEVRLSSVERKPPAVLSVWLDASPRVMVSDDVSLGVGAVTPDGWTVVKIDAGSVVFESPAHQLVTVNL